MAAELLYVGAFKDDGSRLSIESSDDPNFVVECVSQDRVFVSNTKVPVYPRLFDSAKYEFQIMENTDGTAGYIVSLRQVETGKVKNFVLSGERSPVRLISHMNSLTDDLCSQWFNEREKKPKKKA